MRHRSAKFALLVAFVACGLSPLVMQAQQRESNKQAAAEGKPTKPAAKSAVKPDAKPEPAEKEKPAAARPGKERLSVTPEREAAVMTFVKRNHAELAQLLAHLKENQPKEYDRAIRELFRTSDRLTQIHDRDRAQYDLEVQLWKTQSRIQLLTARLKMGESDDLRSQLKELLGEQIDNRTALLRHEREKVATRLTRIDNDITQLESDRQKAVEKQLRALTDSAKTKKGTAKPEARRAAKAAAKDATKSVAKTTEKPKTTTVDAASGSKAAE